MCSMLHMERIHRMQSQTSSAVADLGLEPAGVLTPALIKAGKELGLTQADVGAIVGRDRTALSRGAIEPQSKSGELALLLVRAYRALFVLVGGDPHQMKHWMHTANHHVGGVPAELIKTV